MFNEQEMHSVELLIDEAIEMLAERWKRALRHDPELTDDALQILMAGTMTASKILLMVALGDVSKGEDEWKKLNDDADAHARRNVAKLVESINAAFGFKTDSLVFARVQEDEEGAPYWFAPSALEAWPGGSGGKRLALVKNVAIETISRLADLRKGKAGVEKEVCELAHVFVSVSASKMLLMMVSPAYGDTVERMANRATRELLKKFAGIGGNA